MVTSSFYTKENEMQVFADRLRSIREKRGMSQRELARRSGLSINQISRYENSVIEPSVSAFQAIVRELNISADYLLGFVSDAHDVSSPGMLQNDEQELIQVFRNDGWTGVIRLGAERLSK